MTTKRIIVRLCSIGLLAACSEAVVIPEAVQPEVEEVEYKVPMGVMPLAPRFEEASRTRAWTPPTGYYFYEALYDGSFTNGYTLTNKSIDTFFTKDEDREEEPLHGGLVRESDGTWMFSSKEEVTIEARGYYAYGIIPREAADGVTITRLPDDPASHTYADGAVLTIHGLKSVANDACVMIGAKEGPDADHDNGLTCGDFSFNLGAPISPDATPENYLFFLFDHLCSALVINMRVDAEYNTLRTIRLKEVRLQTASDVAFTKEKRNVVVTLNKTTDGSSPITEIRYAAPSTDKVGSGVVYRNTEGLTLTTEYSAASFLTHFLPQDVTNLVVTSKFDVYDKDTSKNPKGNLVRKDSEATNTIPLNKIAYFTEAERGKKYTLNMTIQPTYLYVMSDPDMKFEMVID